MTDIKVKRLETPKTVFLSSFLSNAYLKAASAIASVKIGYINEIVVEIKSAIPYSVVANILVYKLSVYFVIFLQL